MDQAMKDVPFSDLYSSKQVSVNGIRLNYTDWNPSGKTSYLLVHGLHVQSHVWDPIAATLSEHHRVVCPDLRGHGDSDWARDGYWTRNFVADLHRFVEQLGVGPVIYVGHSLGARIGYVYAAEHPSDLRGMILVDMAPETPREAAQIVTRIVGDASAFHGFRSREHAYEHYKETYPEWQPIFHRLHALHQVRENWANKFVNKHDPDLYWITRSAGLKEVSHLWECAARADVKTLIMWGEKSPYLNAAMLERITQTMPRAEPLVMSCGHAIPRELPDQFLQRTLEFAQTL